MRPRRRDEAELLAAVRGRLLELGYPAGGLSDAYLREGLRRVTCAVDWGRLPAGGLSLSCDLATGTATRGWRGACR
jgi:hypothetical protein